MVQVQGASATTKTIENSISSPSNWLNTEVGQELVEYANRLQFENGAFFIGKMTLTTNNNIKEKKLS